MTILRRVSTFLVLAALTGPVTGCVMGGRPRVGVVYIGRQPPAARVEVIPAAPGVGFVWIRGFWDYRGADFAWVPGRWERPEAGRHAWVAEHWAHDRNGWYLIRGHWR